MMRPQEHPESAQPPRDAAHPSYSRRAFLGRATALGAVLGLAACGGGDEGAEPSEAVEAPEGAAATADVEAAECPSFDALTEADLNTYEALGYVDESPFPEQLCNNCQFYILPEGDSPCGKCQILAAGQGPVAPEGYCNSWVAMAGAAAPADTTA